MTLLHVHEMSQSKKSDLGPKSPTPPKMGPRLALWGRKLRFSYSFLTPRRSKTTPGVGIIGNMENLEFGNLAPGDSRTKNGHEWGQNWSDFDDLGTIRRQIL